MVLQLCINNGLRSPSLMGLPIPIVLAGWLLPARSAIALVIATILAGLALALTERAGLLPLMKYASPPLIVWIAFSVYIALAAVVAYHIFRGFRLRHEALRRLGLDLASRLDELTARDAELRLLMDNVPAMICAYEGMVCRFANPLYARFFGFTTESIVGRHLREIIGETAFEQARPLIEQALAGEQVSYRGRRSSPAFGDRLMEVKLVPDHPEHGRASGFYGLFFDVTEQEQSAEALHKSEARLKEAQRIGLVGSWELDIVSRRIAFSDELYRIYEREPSAFGGTFEDLLKLVHPDDLPGIRQAWLDSATARGSFEIEHRILTPDGRIKHLHVRWEVFRGGDGKPERALGTAQDITEQVRAKKEIQRLNENLEARVRERTAELQTANRELESFAYSISHDLRAPLRGIDGFGQLLLEEYRDRLDEQGQDYLNRMRNAAQRMGTLIDDILELSRVSRKSMGRETVDLSRLAGDILDNKAKSDPLRRVDIAIAPGCTAIGDPQLLRVLMENLLENAWKYTRTKPQARIEFAQETAGGETIHVVRDNGVGFDMRYADRLFGPFQRLHKPEEFEGTGIGLASAARVVHRHGGRIWAEAEVGQGATFRFTLAGSGTESPTSAIDATAV
ncbi:MAG: PAS domain-containing protein [Rhodocyclales bacterium]|nr:PAS domain-containing protein [Rhodocyclales bacterium]